jgi:hypothetical protein
MTLSIAIQLVSEHTNIRDSPRTGRLHAALSPGRVRLVNDMVFEGHTCD